METLDRQVVDQFIINTSLVDPINSIIGKLNNREFRDCDIKWLDDKLENYTILAGKTLGINLSSAIGLMDTRMILNDYVISEYVRKFTVLLNYFKSF